MKTIKKVYINFQKSCTRLPTAVLQTVNNSIRNFDFKLKKYIFTSVIMLNVFFNLFLNISQNTSGETPESFLAYGSRAAV